MKNVILQGHVLDILPTLPENSIHCIVTSPPYWGLRDYGIEPQIWDAIEGCDHVWSETPNPKGNGDGTTFRRDKQAGQKRGQASPGFCSRCGAWKGSLGLEPTPELFIQHLVQILREARRVLRDDGSLWLNLGDSYATGAGKVGDCPGGGKRGEQWAGRGDGRLAFNGRGEPQGYKGTRRAGKHEYLNPAMGPILKPKDLIGIPWRVALALQADGWWLRSSCPWIKRNCMPESCKDRPATAIEYVFLLTKSQRYFYDHEAVKIEASPDSHARYGRARSTDHKYVDADRKYFKSMKLMGGVVAGVNPKAQKIPSSWDTDPGHHEAFHRKGRASSSPMVHGNLPGRRDEGRACNKPDQHSRARRNSDWFFDSWQGLLPDNEGGPLAFVVNTQGYKEAHFATFPEKLVEPCVKAGSSEKGCCPECGDPWVRVTEKTDKGFADRTFRSAHCTDTPGMTNGHRATTLAKIIQTETIGWKPTCSHDHPPIPCTVIDPFGGAGTVG